MKPNKIFTLEEQVSAELFGAWVKHARRGDAIEYHRGFLAIDRVPNISPLPTEAQLECKAVAELAAQLAADGKIYLVQRRLGVGAYSYIAWRA